MEKQKTPFKYVDLNHTYIFTLMFSFSVLAKKIIKLSLLFKFRSVRTHLETFEHLAIRHFQHYIPHLSTCFGVRTDCNSRASGHYMYCTKFKSSFSMKSFPPTVDVFEIFCCKKSFAMLF